MQQDNPEIWYLAELFSRVPVKIALIDRDLRIIHANRYFAETFGDWHGRRCFELYTRKSFPCNPCNAAAVFADGNPRLTQELMIDKNGQVRVFLVNFIPLRLDDGSIPYVAELSTDITEPVKGRYKYEMLFNKVPCFITILDRNLHIIQANERFRATFGEIEGRFCYECYKQKTRPCANCPARAAFRDGCEHNDTMIGIGKSGARIHYVVTATPLRNVRGEVENVMKIATDVTLIRTLETQLKKIFELQRISIASAFEGMISTGAQGNVRIFNKAAEDILGFSTGEIGNLEDLRRILPEDLVSAVWKNKGSYTATDTIITSRTGEKVPVNLSGTVLRDEDLIFGFAVYIQDLRKIKQLESEKLVVERLAAVGQTVAGLAHGIKNILTGLEGGLFVMGSGMQKADGERMQKGFRMLENNINRITHFVKEFLNFARGREPVVRLMDPNAIPREVVELYAAAAAREGVNLISDLQTNISEAPLDSEGIHTCLANLVSNAIDACLMSENDNHAVTIRTRERDGTIFFEVADNGIGMDCEVKRKLFTSFFSTKGSHEGTGLGLLVTRKIVQEHGGTVSFESTEGEETVFRIELPRHRLPQPREAKPEPGDD